MHIKQKTRAAKEAFDDACRAMAAATQCRVIAPAAAAAGVALAPAAAYASFESTIDDITGTGTSILSTIGYGLLVLVGGCALVALAKEILPALFAREKVDFRGRVTALIVVVVVCVIAGFLPTIISAFTDAAGTGVDLGSSQIVK